MEGKFAVVSGSTQGLGEAAVRLFAERGAAGIIVSGRNEERGNAVAADLRAGGCPAYFVRADLADIDACQSIVAEADRQFGALHVLVNCGALTVRGNIWDTTPDLFDQMIAVNARAPFLLMQDACKLMRREGNGGSIVNVSSVASFGSEQFLLPYSASKGALNVMTKNVAYAVMRYGIRVNALAIGWMDTPSPRISFSASFILTAKTGWRRRKESNLLAGCSRLAKLHGPLPLWLPTSRV